MESAPTGCFKCGRPGHWSRDCPSSAPATGDPSASTPADSSQIPNNENQRSSFPKNGNRASMALATKAKKTKVQRPKLTPELLLSEDGLGYVLRYFPRSFKYHGRGKVVSDLGNLIGLYSEWHSRLLPSFSFDQFVHKVQQVATSKRVKICINELRERVASGVDPNKLYEKQEEYTGPSDDHGIDEPSHDQETTPSKSVDVDDDNTETFQDSMMNEIFDTAMDTTDNSKQPSDEQSTYKSSDLTEEQKARMEANKLKAMERAKNISEEQRTRMEASRLKALERAKARLRPNQDS